MTPISIKSYKNLAAVSIGQIVIFKVSVSSGLKVVHVSQCVPKSRFKCRSNKSQCEKVKSPKGSWLIPILWFLLHPRIDHFDIGQNANWVLKIPFLHSIRRYN